MDQSIYWELMTTDLVMASRTTLRFIHLIGLALGLGAATLLDLMLIRFFVWEKISRESWRIFYFFSKTVNVGLVLLWTTGIGFIVHYALFDPIKLQNEKIWAKLAIVWILSLNGLFIHAVVLPKIEAQIGKTLFGGMNRFQRSALLVSGSISAISWYVPLILAAFPQLNFSVPATTILLTYSALLVVSITATHVIFRFINPAGYETSSPADTDAIPPLVWGLPPGWSGVGVRGHSLFIHGTNPMGDR